MTAKLPKRASAKVADPDSPAWTEAMPAEPALRRGRGSQSGPTKVLTSLRLDADVLDYFRSQGADYESRINDTLRKAVSRNRTGHAVEQNPDMQAAARIKSLSYGSPPGRSWVPSDAASQPSLAELLSPDRLTQLDSVSVAAFNARTKEPYRLHPELGPSAFEGDIDKARVVLLMGNPGYDQGSTPDDHRFARAGWPLGGLHPEAPDGLLAWWSSRLRALTDLFGAQMVSQRVACLQYFPWASNKFGTPPRLPSKTPIMEAATRCAERGCVLLVMRAEPYWLQSESVRSSQRRYRVNSWRSSYVSPGNLPAEGWRAVVAAVGDP